MKNSNGHDSDSFKDMDFEEPKSRVRIRTKGSQEIKQKPIQEIEQFRIRKSERQQAQSYQKERERNLQKLRQEESKDHFLNYEVPKKIMMLEEAMLLQGLKNSLQTANHEQEHPQMQARPSLNNDLNIEHTLRAGGGQPEYEKMQKIIGKYFGLADIQIIVRSPKIGILEQLQINASPTLYMAHNQIKIQQPKLTSMEVMVQNQDDNGIMREIKFLLLIDYLYGLGIIEKAVNQNISIQPDYNVCSIGLEGEKQQQVMQLHNLIQNICKYVIVTYGFNSKEDLQVFMGFMSKIKQIKDDIIEITYINSFNQIRLQKMNDAIKIKYYLENNYIYGLISNMNNMPINNLQEMFNSLINNITDDILQDEESMFEEESSESYLSEANITLQDNKIQCWNLYLKKKYNNDSIQVTQQQDKIILTLFGDHEYVVQLQKQIEIQLSTLKYSTLRFFVPDLNPKLLNILNQYPINQIFWRDINKIKQVTQAQYLQLQEIDVKNFFIAFAVVHEQQDQLLVAALKKMFIKVLEFHFVDVDLNQVLDYTKQSKQQFETEYNCFIQLTDQQSYVTLSHHNDKIRQLIKDYLKIVANFGTVKIIVPQKFLQNLIKEALKSGLINKNIQVDCLNDTFILKGNEELLSQAESLITDYKQQMISSFQFKDFPLTLKQWEFLQKNHLKEIQDIEEQYECIIIVQSNQQIQEDRKFAQKILIESNEAQLVQSLDIVQEYIDVSIGCKDIAKIQGIENILQGIIKNYTELMEWQVLNLQKEDLQQAQEFILKNSILTKGILKFGNQIQIQCSKKKFSKLNEYLLNLKDKLVYPKNWIAQEDNFISVELQQDQQEYKDVLKQFLSTYSSGKIYQINRLQNKALYNNFHLEKAKLIQLRQKNGNAIKEDQIEKFLWHGVKGLHPMAIYNGQKEAFDHTYSNNNCLWGPGIYFSESAEYSKKYSYTLQENDSVKYKGKKVMLLCLVCRGKVAYQKQDNTIRRPPENHDCVSGLTENNEITVLYGMDVRRAYPSYEIIFE